MKKSIVLILVSTMLLFDLGCKRNIPIENLDIYVETILNALKLSNFNSLKPIMLVSKDSATFNSEIYKKGAFEQDDITSFMINKAANKSYKMLLKDRFSQLQNEFQLNHIDLPNIKLITYRLRGIFVDDNGSTRSSCDVVFESGETKYILILSDVLCSNKVYKNFNFYSLDTYDAEMSRRHEQLMKLVPLVKIGVTEWNTSAFREDFNSPVRLKNFVIVLDNSTNWNFEEISIKIKLFDTRSNQSPIYTLNISRQIKLSSGERIQIEVQELENYIIPEDVALGKYLDAKFEIVDLKWVDEFEIMN